MDTKQTREALKALREELDTALAAVRDNNPGLTLKLGGCRFDADGSFTFKLDGVIPGGKSRESGDYEALARSLAIPVGQPGASYYRPGITLPKLGETFRMGPTVYGKVVGARLRAKYNVVVEHTTGSKAGKRYCYAAEALAAQIRLYAQRSAA